MNPFKPTNFIKTKYIIRVKNLVRAQFLKQFANNQLPPSKEIEV